MKASTPIALGLVALVAPAPAPDGKPGG